MKPIISARVSTEEQMNEGQSIPTQPAHTREYAKRKKLKVYKCADTFTLAICQFILVFLFSVTEIKKFTPLEAPVGAVGMQYL